MPCNALQVHKPGVPIPCVERLAAANRLAGQKRVPGLPRPWMHGVAGAVAGKEAVVVLVGEVWKEDIECGRRCRLAVDLSMVPQGRNEIGLQRVHCCRWCPGAQVGDLQFHSRRSTSMPCRLRTNGVCTHMGQLSANSAQPFNSRSPISADTCSHRPSRGCSILLALSTATAVGLETSSF